MNPRRFFGVLVFFLIVAGPLNAARLGDPAGTLSIKDWVKGKPVQLTPSGIYVVEFWATWCGPCRTTIPRLTEMQTKFKGVTFIGISDEPADVVKPFVAQMGDQMNYIVACDDERKTAMSYMDAYGQQGIPTAFIVKDRKVLWFGHPLAEMEPMLEKIVNGSYDLKDVQKKEAERAAWTEYVRASMAGEPRAAELGKKFLDGMPNELEALVSFAFGIVSNMQNKNRDFSLAMLALDRAEKLTSEKNALILGVRGITMFESGRRDQGLALAREAVTICKDPQRLPILQNYVRVLESAMQSRPQTGSAPAPGSASSPPRPIVPPANPPPPRR